MTEIDFDKAARESAHEIAEVYEKGTDGEKLRVLAKFFDQRDDLIEFTTGTRPGREVQDDLLRMAIRLDQLDGITAVTLPTAPGGRA